MGLCSIGIQPLWVKQVYTNLLERAAVRRRTNALRPSQELNAEAGVLPGTTTRCRKLVQGTHEMCQQVTAVSKHQALDSSIRQQLLLVQHFPYSRLKMESNVRGEGRRMEN